MIRKIHLDFHTHPDTRGIGAGFNADAFADTLARAHVNYLATPGKCHFGNIYYASKVGRTHPQLADPEMFPATVRACAKRGIKVQAYWTLGLDAHAAHLHPDWRQRYADGAYGNWGHYLHMCFASPYIDKMVIPEIVECIERCPGLAGFWFDIALYVDGAFYATGFETVARERLGDQAADVTARWWLARQIIRERCIELDAAIKARLPGAENYFNSLVVPGEPQNLPLQPLQEVENPILFGGPEKMTAHVRWLRGRGARTIGLVSRFQGPWSDPGTLRTPDQMRFDVARTVALGCDVSMGDHRYPDGHLEPEVYRRLAPIYEQVAKADAWLAGARPCREAVLLAPLCSGSGKGLLFPDLAPSTLAAARVLEELGIQFDIASTADELPAADLVVWPGDEPGSPELLARLAQHVKRGGALLGMHAALTGAEDLFGAQSLPWTPAKTEAVSGMASIGHVAGSAASADTCGPTEQFLALLPACGGPEFPHILLQPTRRIAAAADAAVLAEFRQPIAAKPPFAGVAAIGPAIVQKSRVIYCAPALFAEHAESGSPLLREFIGTLCGRLQAKRLVRHDGGTSVAAHLHRTRQGYNLHLVHWAMERWHKQLNPVAEFPTIGPITVELDIPEPVVEVALLPGGETLSFRMVAGRCVFSVPRLHVWQALAVRVWPANT